MLAALAAFTPGLAREPPPATTSWPGSAPAWRTWSASRAPTSPPMARPPRPPTTTLPGLPPFAFTPVTDRGVISPVAADKTPIAGPVPGIQLEARIASDPTGQARFLLRLPTAWNGRLVVAGASGHPQRVQRRLGLERLRDPEGLRLRLPEQGGLQPPLLHLGRPAGLPAQPRVAALRRSSTTSSPARPFTRWAEYMVDAARLARRGVHARYGKEPQAHLRGGDVQRRLPGAPRGRVGSPTSSTAAWTGRGPSSRRRRPTS